MYRVGWPRVEWAEPTHMGHTPTLQVCILQYKKGVTFWLMTPTVHDLCFRIANGRNLIFVCQFAMLILLFYLPARKEMVYKTSLPLIESEKLFEKSLIGKLWWNRHFFLMSIELSTFSVVNSNMLFFRTMKVGQWVQLCCCNFAKTFLFE